MATRGLYVFKHDSKLGNAHAYSLFSRIQPRLKDGIAVPRDFSDYDVHVEGGSLNLGESKVVLGVSVMRRC
ncbi:MAG: type I CRISPR-associated protein Cas7 [Burkholderiales bacterium]